MKLIDGVMVENFRRFVPRTSFDTSHHRVLITGPNGSGKSSIKQAIEFSATGHITGEPKKDGDLWVAIGRDDRVTTGVAFGQIAVQRELVRNKSKTTHKGCVNGTDYKKAEMEVGISKHLGGRINVLDLSSSFWNLTGPAKLNFLLRYYKGDLNSTTIDAKFDKKLRCENPKLDVSSTIETILSNIRLEKSTLQTNIKGYDTTIKITTQADNDLEAKSGNLSDYEKEESKLKIDVGEMYRGQSSNTEENLTAWKEERRVLVGEIEALNAKNLKTVAEYDEERGLLAYEKYTGVFADFVDKLMESVSTANCGICGPKLLIKKTSNDIKAEQERIKGADQEIKKLQALRDDAESLANKKAELVKLDADPRGIAISDSEKESSKAIAGMEARLEELAEIKKVFEKKQTYQSLIAKSKEDRANDEETLEDIKKSEEDAVALRKKILADVFDPVMAAIDKTLPSGKSVIELDENKNLFIGWHIDKDRKVRRSALSGGESVIFDTAMALGLVQLGKSKADAARVLIIEGAELDQNNFSLFCDKLLQLPADVQIFLLNCTKTETFSNDWKVISFWGK